MENVTFLTCALCTSTPPHPNIRARALDFDWSNQLRETIKAVEKMSNIIERERMVVTRGSDNFVFSLSNF